MPPRDGSAIADAGAYAEYGALAARSLDAGSIDTFLRDWSALTDRIEETYQRLQVTAARNTADRDASERLESFLAEVYAPAQEGEQRAREALLASGIEPEG